MLGGSLINSEDVKFLSGVDEAGHPVGVRYCPGMIYLNRHGAGTVTWEDVLAMQGALHPDSMGNAVFIANQGLLPVLEDVKDNSGNRVYLTRDYTNDLPDRLDGIPVIYTGKVGAKGAKGDLILVDLSYYVIKDGLDLLISTSEHVKFLSDRTVIKINRSVDGKGWITGPMTLEDGTTTVSPFVGLDVPAIS
jgi:HK97 family phage major capsid protein